MARRKSRKTKRISLSAELYYAMISSLAVMLIFALSLFLSSRGFAFPMNIAGFVGILCILFSVGNIIISFKQLQNNECDFIWRIISIVLSISSFGIWIVVYFIGLASNWNQ